jgi:hypothetical protein
LGVEGEAETVERMESWVGISRLACTRYVYE